MANELKSLSVLFNNRLFRIPDYQRGYAWKHEQLVDFWEDLLNLQDDKYHYTGLLSMKAVNRADVKDWQGDDWLLDEGFETFHIVDGQQRLTTFSILVHGIVAFVSSLSANKGKADNEIYIGKSSLDRIKEKYIVRKLPPANLVTTYLFGYEIDNPSENYLKYRVFDEPFADEILETYYTKNLGAAKKFFADNLALMYAAEEAEGRSGMDAIEKLFRKLTLQLKFNLHEIEDDYDVFVAFETMNNRGKKLTNLELLKNRLIYLTTLYKDADFDARSKEQLRRNINDAWRQVYRQLGRNKAESLPDDEFLRAHWITYFSYSRKKGDDYIKFLLRHFSAKNVFEKLSVAQDDDAEEAVLSDSVEATDDEVVENEAEATKDVSKLEASAISDYVNSLKAFAEFWYYSWFPLDPTFTATADEKKWLDKLNRIGIAYFRPLVVAALATKNRTTADDRVELFKAIERFIFVSFRVGAYQTSWLSSDYYNKSREVMLGNVTLVQVAAELNKLVDGDDGAIKQFITRMQRNFKDRSGFYSWWGLRYFLFEYERDLTDIKGNERDGATASWKLFANSEKDKVTIEHIFPQTPTRWYWRNQFRIFTDIEKKVLSGTLGNLLPLSQSINSSLQNDSFDEKKNPSKKRRGYSHGSHSEIEVSKRKDWNAAEIMKRGLHLLSFMETRWKIKLSKAQKNELLGIDFVNDGRPATPELPKNDADEFAVEVAKHIESRGGIKWSERWQNTIGFTTPFIDKKTPKSDEIDWWSGRSVVYEIVCDNSNGVSFVCKIFSRAESTCEQIYTHCQSNSDFVGIKYGKDGIAAPTKRRKYGVPVFVRTLLSADDIAGGLDACKDRLIENIKKLFEVDVVEFEKMLAERM